MTPTLPVEEAEAGFEEETELEEEAELMTQHTMPDWLEKLMKGLPDEIEKCSSRTREAVEKNEKIEVHLFLKEVVQI